MQQEGLQLIYHPVDWTLLSQLRTGLWTIGKHEECEKPRHEDSNSGSCVAGPKQLQPASSIWPATSRSLGLDLATTIDITLIDRKPVKIPTGIKGPVMYKEKPYGELLLGRSSAGLKGLFVSPGVIDADFTGEILIVAVTFYPPLIIPAGSKIAQLVPMLQLTEAASSVMQWQKGPESFGSTGSIALLCLPMEEQPKAPVILGNGQQMLQLSVLLDTGADITIVSKDC
ncbi:hypothetical protein DV515_00016449 [Chloebia gouldiae]|uniref:Peptidase A2 domain-containing protein n=1 Tax=Chloebia gouldiae TaxID=44316 RepID=A0A3L8RTU1_CHLGU|nr:hypothetical protein DV515_00016449 [Chloebia gouldiae]